MSKNQFKSIERLKKEAIIRLRIWWPIM